MRNPDTETASCPSLPGAAIVVGTIIVIVIIALLT